MSKVQKTLSYLKRNGWKKTCYQVIQRIREEREDQDTYNRERTLEAASVSQLRAQAEETFEDPVKISILVPAYETPEDFLRNLIDSVLVQSYENFELCIADAGSTDGVLNVMAQYDDPRIRYQRLAVNEGISGNTNQALAMATGDVIALLDHDDFLEPDALYHLVRAFEKGAKFVYTDEDKYEDGRYFKPNRKTDFNPDLFLSNNYICHLFAVRTDIARAVGGLRSEYDGAQDYDFILRLAEKIMESDAHRYNGNLLNWSMGDPRFAHVPRVLYHWRVHENSTAENPESKLYAYDSGLRVLEDFLKRHGIGGTVSHTDHLGFYSIFYEESIRDDSYVNYIDPGMRPMTEDGVSKLASCFARPEVAAVTARVLDRRKCTVGGAFSEDGTMLYRGMKYWDSGLMHRAHQRQNSSRVNEGAYLVRDGVDLNHLTDECGLIVYDPTVSFIKEK